MSDLVSAVALPPRTGRHLDVDGVWKSYGGEKFVVRDASFVLEPGEFLTLLGPSGSGKTTTLMMIAGFETLSRGRIRVDGHDITAQPPEQRNFGIVFQGYALFPHMNVLDNVAFPLRMKGVGHRARQRQAAEMLEKVALEGLASRRPHELSGGQQQRAALPAPSSRPTRCATHLLSRAIASCTSSCRSRASRSSDGLVSRSYWSPTIRTRR
jgi:ABC-type Fe3+/spermidine/putrescine transport system ATPase subunit